MATLIKDYTQKSEWPLISYEKRKKYVQGSCIIKLDRMQIISVFCILIQDGPGLDKGLSQPLLHVPLGALWINPAVEIYIVLISHFEGHVVREWGGELCASMV